MKKWKLLLLASCLTVFTIAGCGNEKEQDNADGSTVQETVLDGNESDVAVETESSVEEVESTEAESDVPVEVESDVPAETESDVPTEVESDVTVETESTEVVEEEEEVKEMPALEDIEFVDVVPVSDSMILYKNSGTIQKISYTTKDYSGDEHEITKEAFVYLPYGYDETKQYNVLYLMHGIGGNIYEWGMTDNNSRVKAMMDNLIANNVIEPFIVVAANGRSGADFANTNGDWNMFYLFGKELRNDLIPYIDANFATYAEYSENGYDLTAARDHRAMAGLSMGGMQTTNIGMCECLDIISYFGAFSAAPTTYDSTKIAECLKNFEEYDINYYYGVCGTDDGIAISSSSAAVNGLTDKTDKLEDGVNFKWQTLRGGHDFTIWYLGYYNFARIVFK